jgi:hypothetical protein
MGSHGPILMWVMVVVRFVSRSIVMELTKLLIIKILTRHADHCQKVRVVTRWSDIYRGYGEYILMGVE